MLHNTTIDSGNNLLATILPAIALPNPHSNSLSTLTKAALLFAVFSIAIIAACGSYHYCAQPDRAADNNVDLEAGDNPFLRL